MQHPADVAVLFYRLFQVLMRRMMVEACPCHRDVLETASLAPKHIKTLLAQHLGLCLRRDKEEASGVDAGARCKPYDITLIGSLSFTGLNSN